MSIAIGCDFDDVLVMTGQHMNDLFEKIFHKLINPEADFNAYATVHRHLYQQHGSTLHGWAKMHNLPLEWVIEKQHQIHEEVMGVGLEQLLPLLQPDPLLILRLERLKKVGALLFIITHGHRGLTIPILKHMGMDRFFPESHIYDVTILNGASKREEETYRRVLNEVVGDKVFNRHFMLEDTAANLPAAKKLGFTTLYVSPSPPPAPHDEEIDHHFPTTHHALEYIEAQLAA